MCDIFISYAREDKEKVRPIASALARHWAVFWDEEIPPAVDYTVELTEKMATAKAAIVFWSKDSCVSIYVLKEVMQALAWKKLVPVLLESDVWEKIPEKDGLEKKQAVDLSGWDGDEKNLGYQRLRMHLENAIGFTQPTVSMPDLLPGEIITEKHLTLVHSSWRVKERDAEFHDGRRYYRIHVMVVGRPQALDRIEKVVYHLDKAYGSRAKQEAADRRANFELKDLANGYSVVYADIVLKNDVRRLHLSRFINLTETGPRLADEFFQQR